MKDFYHQWTEKSVLSMTITSLHDERVDSRQFGTANMFLATTKFDKLAARQHGHVDRLSQPTTRYEFRRHFKSALWLVGRLRWRNEKELKSAMI